MCAGDPTEITLTFTQAFGIFLLEQALGEIIVLITKYNKKNAVSCKYAKMASERNYISSHLLAVMHYRQYRTTVAFYGGSFASHQYRSPASDTDYHLCALVGISEEHPQ